METITVSCQTDPFQTEFYKFSLLKRKRCDKWGFNFHSSLAADVPWLFLVNSHEWGRWWWRLSFFHCFWGWKCILMGEEGWCQHSLGPRARHSLILHSGYSAWLVEAALGCILRKHGCPSLSPHGSVFGSFKERNSFLFLSDLFCMEQPSCSCPLGVYIHLSAWKVMVFIEETCNTEMEGQSSLWWLLLYLKTASPWCGPLLHQLYSRLIVRMFSYTRDLGK